MVTRNKLPAASVLLGSLLWTASAGAYEIQTNTAKMQAMDKITGRVSVIEVQRRSEVRKFFDCRACLQKDAAGRNAGKLRFC